MSDNPRIFETKRLILSEARRLGAVGEPNISKSSGAATCRFDRGNGMRRTYRGLNYVDLLDRMEAQGKHEMTTEEKRDLAISLIRRSIPAIEDLAANIEKSQHAYTGKTLAESQLEWAERELEHVYELVGELCPHDVDFWRDSYRLAGKHAVLTDEGWEPFDDPTAFEGIEILDEVNAPDAATETKVSPQ